jgi:enamine deaminase RidA (YjgF/YER057c/UK114 family)
LEHFVSSQEWLHLRLALWRDYFGMIGTAGGGAQALMSGINMVTTTVVAVVSGTQRIVVEGPPSAPLPGPWTQRGNWVKQAYQPKFSLEAIRCCRAVQVGDLIFTVGVRGHVNPTSAEVAPVETPDAFGAQIRNCYEEYSSFLKKAGLTLRDLVRVDSHIRNVNRAAEYWASCAEICGESIPFVTAPIGMPVGGTGEMDMCAIAAAPGVTKEVMWNPQRLTVAQAVRVGGLVFASGCNGLHDSLSGEILDHACRDARGQTRQAFRRLEAVLGRFDVGLEGILRLDVVLRDVHFEDEFLEVLREVLGQHWPAVTICGGEPVDRAEVELSAIAAA